MKILVVDDDALINKMVSSILEKAGHKIAKASDGNEAISKAHAETFDLVITDILMPKKDGMNVIQEIRKICPSVKILAISSSGMEGHSTILKIAEAHGSDGSLQKPFTPEQLFDKIAEIMAPG